MEMGVVCVWDRCGIGRVYVWRCVGLEGVKMCGARVCMGWKEVCTFVYEVKK